MSTVYCEILDMKARVKRFITTTITSLQSLSFCVCLFLLILHRACPRLFFVFMLNLATMEMKCPAMGIITLCVDSILTSQKITCIYNAGACKARGLGSFIGPHAVDPHCGTNIELAGSTYRIQPIQERAKRPLWTINNRASGFVSCLWEHKENKRARDKVWEWRYRASSSVSELPVKTFI